MSALEQKLRMSVALLGGDSTVTTKEVVPMETQLAVRNDLPSRQLFAINTFDEAMRFAKLISSTEFVPQAYRNKPEAALAAIMMGAELGIGPMQALQGIAVINGRPSVWGDLALAMCQRAADFVDCIETYDAVKQIATCTIKRKGKSDTTRQFGRDDAARANLLGKDTYKSYPARMFQMRARSYAMRDAGADWLRGLSIVEETRDYITASSTVMPYEPDVTSTVQMIPPPMQPTAATAAPMRTESMVRTTDPEDFVIKAGKNAGKALRELGYKALEWYASECKDLPTRAAASDAIKSRPNPDALPAQPSAAYVAEFVDQDGVVHNTNAGEMAS